MGVPINNVTRRVVYAASGTGPYAFTFEILAATDIAVYRDDTLLTITTDYTVTIAGNGTGSITLTAAPTGATQIAIVGNRTIQRTTDFVTGGDFFANTLNDELDQQTIFAQQNAEGLQRALQAPQTDPTSINMTLPGRTARANKTLSFDANGNPTPGVSAADVANAVTYATNAANSATAAAASASAASSSASSASSSASTATTQASNASSSASAASTSASNASTSATNAANSASSASTSASNASTSATNAANSASTATTQASNAATSATNAANSATAAATSETNAANSATAAASSATAAAASASAAANTFDSFDDRYLGTKASNPTLDNDGNALVAGALYFSTSENIMKVYDGASWIAATSAGNVSFLRFRYVATSGQTTFSGADSNAATLSYTVNNIVVFLNGVALDQTEYTATSGTSVVLGTGAALNDELVIVAFKSFVTADMVPASTGGTYAGNITYSPGTANGVMYLNGSKVMTAGSALVFDGTNFGIGGTPGAKLEVIDGNSQVRNSATQTQGTVLSNGLTFRATNQIGQDRGVIAAIKPYFGNGSDNDFGLAFQTQATTAGGVTTKGILDPVGNFGLGVTPSAWSVPALQMSRGSFTSLGGGPNDHAAVVANAYTSSGTDPASVTWRYVNTGAAALYQAGNGGQHRWSSAASGTAGNIFSFTQILAANLNETLALQGAVPQTGTGITFPATQSASSNANTLDDYEEGTISGSNLGLAYATPGTSSFTYSDRRGTYTKIGRVVYFTIDIRLSAFTKGTASGSLFVVGLPFVQRDTSGFDSARCTVQLYNWTYTTSPIIAAILTNSTSIAIERMVSNAVTTTIDDPNSNSIIWITGFYFV